MLLTSLKGFGIRKSGINPTLRMNLYRSFLTDSSIKACLIGSIKSMISLSTASEAELPFAQVTYRFEIPSSGIGACVVRFGFREQDNFTAYFVIKSLFKSIAAYAEIVYGKDFQPLQSILQLIVIQQFRLGKRIIRFCFVQHGGGIGISFLLYGCHKPVGKF